MRNARGYIAIDRGIFDHRMFKRRPEWLVAWQWLIAAAAWKAEGRRGSWGVTHVERGQLVSTVRILGTTWGWPKSNVDRFLKRLVREEMVTLKTGTGTGTGTGTLSHPVTIISVCNYDKFQDAARRAQIPGQEPGQEPGQQMQEVPLLQGLIPPEPANQSTIDKKVETGGEGGEEGQASRRHIKPRHGAKGRGMVWLDHGTPEWELYAADFRQTRGADKLPENRVGGKGNWFLLMGEATARFLLPQKRRAS